MKHLFLGSFRRHLLLGLLACLAVALVCGTLGEVWLFPGALFRAQRQDRAVLNGLAAYGDVDFDGWLDRLRESDTSDGSASFSLETRRPGQPAPTQQFYLPGKDILVEPFIVQLDSNRIVLVALTDEHDSLCVRLNLKTFRRDGTGSLWSRRLVLPESAHGDRRLRCNLQGAIRVERAGRPWLQLALNAPFQGWRGALLVDPENPERQLAFPNGLAPAPRQENWLRNPDGRVRWLLGSAASNNGNCLGGHADSLSKVFLFDPDSGFVFSRTFGSQCRSLRVDALPDRRHALLTTKHGFDTDSLANANLLVWDSWQARIVFAARIPGLDVRALPTEDDVQLATPEGHLWCLTDPPWNLRECGRLRLRTNEYLFSIDGYWVTLDQGHDFGVYRADGRLLARVPVQDVTQFPRIEHAQEGLDGARLHVATEQAVLSFGFEAIPLWQRVVGNRALLPGGLLAFLVLLTSLTRRISLQERVLRSIVNSGSESVGILDARNRLLYANESFLRDTEALDIPGLLGKAASADPLQKLADGRWIRWTVRTLSLKGKHFGQALLGFDDSARVTRGEMRMLVNVSGNLAHDLRNPITSITRAVANLQARLQDVLPGQESGLGRSLGIIHDSSGLLNRRLQNFMDMIQVPEFRQPVDLGEVAGHSLKDNQLDTMSALEVVWQPPGGAHPVLASPGTLLAMVNVLVVNAVEAMVRKGRLTLTLDLRDGLVELRITDTGGGIDPALEERIWAPGCTTKKAGSGYGLFFARDIARTYGGEIRVERTCPAGTTMLLTLPLYTTPVDGTVRKEIQS
jgi:signal transduction histidine kinase